MMQVIGRLRRKARRTTVLARFHRRKFRDEKVLVVDDAFACAA